MRYYQSRLRQGNAEMRGWIEERAAKVGKIVEVLPDGGMWNVTEVFTPGIEVEDLREKQKLDRNCLPSIQVIA